MGVTHQVSGDHEQLTLQDKHGVGKFRRLADRGAGDTEAGDGLVGVAAGLDQRVVFAEPPTEESTGGAVVTDLM